MLLRQPHHGEGFGDDGQLGLGVEADRGLSARERGREIRVGDAHATDVAGLGELLHELPARIHVAFVAARMQGERHQGQHHGLRRARPANLPLETLVEQIIKALYLDWAGVLTISAIDSADGARHGGPFALSVLDDDLLGNIGEVRHGLDGDRDQPILLDHAVERPFPPRDVIIIGVGPGGLDLRQDGARAALMQHPIHLDLVLLGLDLFHRVDDIPAPFDRGDLGGGVCGTDRAQRIAEHRGRADRGSSLQCVPARDLYHGDLSVSCDRGHRVEVKEARDRTLGIHHAFALFARIARGETSRLLELISSFPCASILGVFYLMLMGRSTGDRISARLGSRPRIPGERDGKGRLRFGCVKGAGRRLASRQVAWSARLKVDEGFSRRMPVPARFGSFLIPFQPLANAQLR